MGNEQKESTEQSKQMGMEATARFGDIVPGEHSRLRLQPRAQPAGRGRSRGFIGQ